MKILRIEAAAGHVAPGADAGAGPSGRPGDRQMKRLLGLAAGLGTQAVFAATVVSLFEFLRYGAFQVQGHWLVVDTALALQFAVPHSILLHPATRKRLGRWIRPEFYGLFYCVCTCCSLQLLFFFWRGSQHSLWDLQGGRAAVVIAAFYGSWVMLFCSLHLTGLGYQTGWTQWLFWWRGMPMPRRDFVPRGLYRLLRHPVYLSFLGLIWLTPRMTTDHAVLTGLWTVYIAVGSVLKDQRLAFYLGDGYRDYQQRVAGYPLIFFGPLGRLRTPAPPPDQEPETVAASGSTQPSRPEFGHSNATSWRRAA